MGRTPWSARVPLDPLFANEINFDLAACKPARGPAADQGVRPTIYADHTMSSRRRAGLSEGNGAILVYFRLKTTGACWLFDDIHPAAQHPRQLVLKLIETEKVAEAAL